MTLQWLVDGIVDGTLIALGAAGVTLTYATLRFGNFAHGELVSAGGYLALILAALVGTALPLSLTTVEGLTATPALLLALVIGAALTGALAVAIDRLVFRTLRQRGSTIAMSMASFGVSMALRALIESTFSARPRYYSEELSIAWNWDGLHLAPDRALVAVLALQLLAVVHVWLKRSRLGREMRAVGENPLLAAVVGLDVTRVYRVTWILSGMLAGAAGVGLGLLSQVRPSMGADLLLPMFAAAILGGLGSLPGAVIGGWLIGCAEALAVDMLGAQWRSGVAFALLVLVLLLKPNGLFGRSGERL